ncbi:MAG: 50S ribosomal protein L11 methyltransferase [Terricaulis sp.]
MVTDIPAFIRANTRVLAPPHVPELKLHLADNAVALWELTEEEMGEMGLPPPYWAFAWAGGQALARYVIDAPALVRGKSVLDVATGSGIVAIAAMRAGAASAIAMDIDDFAINATTLNAALNEVSLDARQGDPIGDPTPCDTILVGDAFYDRTLAARVFEWLLTLQAAGKQILIGDPGRTYLPKDRLVKIAEYDVPVSRQLEDSEIKRTAVWRLA